MRRNALRSQYGPQEIALFTVASIAICFIAALVMLAH
jgi:type III secretory pathway component EscR